MTKKTVSLSLICLAGLATALAVWWPRSPEYYFNRGRDRLFAYGDEGGDGSDLDGALADFNRAIKLNPAYPDAFVRRGWIKQIKGDHEGTLADFNQAIQLDLTNASHYRNRGDYWQSRSNFAMALADFNRAIELNPKDERNFSARAQLRRASGDFGGTLADLTREMEVTPPDSTAFLAVRGNQRSMTNDSARVLNRLLRMFDRALEESPDSSWHYYHRGIIKHLANDLAGALADFRRCADFPDNNLKDYAAIHIWLVRAQKNEQPEASRELADYLDKRPKGITRDWEAQIARFLLDQINEADFSNAVGGSDAERERSQFWYYSAMKQLLAGNSEKAADFFLKSRFTETRPYAVAISSQIKLSAWGR